MVNRVYEFMIRHNMAAKGSCILAAVSGGADSMCLLEVLATLRPRAGFGLRVLHVHHGLRESADGDLEHVSKYCSSAGIPFQAVYVDAGGYAVKNGMSVEEAARNLRYAALEQAAGEWDQERGAQSDPCRIAVAHHIEDQAETVLFNIVRGSRLTGLRGMLPVNGRIIRPLLEVSRDEIEAFLVQRGISWREDETNEDLRYTRNLIRKEVMPLLVKINAGAREHIARAAEEAAETEEYLRSETERVRNACCAEAAGPRSEYPAGSRAGTPADGPGMPQEPGWRQGCPGSPGSPGRDGAAGTLQEPGWRRIMVNIPELIQEPELIRRRVVYAVLADAAGGKKDLQDVHVQAVLRLIQKKGNGELDLAGGVHVKKSYELLYFDSHNSCHKSRGGGTPEEACLKSGGSCTAAEACHKSRGGGTPQWAVDPEAFTCRVFMFDGDMDAVPRNQYTKWFDYDKIGTFPEFRTRRGGDRITLDESGRSKTIARYMIDAKVPRDLRERIVMPAVGSEILWVPVPSAGRSATDIDECHGSRGTGTAAAAEACHGSRGTGTGRISSVYKVSGKTRTILEIRWEPNRAGAEPGGHYFGI